jgi:NAD(P)-dependent dehydrogenase (short-subunit alcohol dehydrogenase family)
VSWEDPRGKIVVVTGASSGIGEATARRLARAGVTVVAVARRRERLEALARELAGAPGKVVPYAADVADTAAVDALAGWVEAEFGACHALINNAGLGGGGFNGRDDLDDTLRTLDVNLLGTFRCLAAFADLLERSAPSRVVNVASVAGKLGIGPAGYAASKFGVVGLSEALNLSWARRGITVTQLNPGYILTEGFQQEHLMGGPLEKLVGRPEDVAERIVEVLRSGAPERTVPGWYRPLVALRHLAPPVYRAIASRMERAGGERGAPDD